MKISTNILIPVALLAMISCSQPRKDNVVEVTPGAPLFPASPAQGGASANVNPAHGQPGHNCAVPVGAPLSATPTPGQNTAPAASAAPAAITTQPAAPTSLPIAAPGQTAPGTNPAHGQPGHDCAVAVGAPLPAK